MARATDAGERISLSAKNTSCGSRATRKRCASSPCTRAKGSNSTSSFAPTSGGRAANPRPAFHDPAADDRLTLDLADANAHLPRREEESRAEQLAAVLRRADAGKASLHHGLASGGQRRTSRRPPICSKAVRRCRPEIASERQRSRLLRCRRRRSDAMAAG